MSPSDERADTPAEEDPAAPALQRAREGDVSAVGPLLEEYRGRLARMVNLRLDPRLAGRVDASDVLQESYVEITERLPRYLAEERMPFFLWVRFLVAQKLAQVHRRHLGTRGRDAAREVPLAPRVGPDASSLAVASAYLAHSETPSQVVGAEEERERVRRALDALSPMDREVLVLRHFEELSNSEVATLLGLAPSAASARYVRALQRLSGAVA